MVDPVDGHGTEVTTVGAVVEVGVEAALVVGGAVTEVLEPVGPAVVAVLDVGELPQAARDKMVPTASPAITEARRARPLADLATA